jgi:hypothetical protein
VSQSLPSLLPFRLTIPMILVLEGPRAVARTGMRSIPDPNLRSQVNDLVETSRDLLWNFDASFGVGNEICERLDVEGR